MKLIHISEATAQSRNMLPCGFIRSSVARTTSLNHLHQPQQRRHIINRTLDNQRFYRAAIFAAISIELPIIAIGMRFDLRKSDACVAYWTRIFGSYAKRYILKAHELPLHSISFGERPKGPRLGADQLVDLMFRDFASTDRFHSRRATNNCIKSLT